MKASTKDAIKSLRSELNVEMEAVQSPIPPPVGEDEELWESMKGIVKKLGTRGLDRLMAWGALDKKEIFAIPGVLTKNPLDPEGPEWKWSVKAWWDAVDEVVKRGDAWVMGRQGFGPNYQAVYSLWKDEFESEFGLRPKRTKEQSFAKAVEAAMKKAVKTVIKVVGTISPKEMEKLRKEIGKEA